MYIKFKTFKLMKTRTIEDGFDYQMKNIFQEMSDDYVLDQEEKVSNNEQTETFAEWLWKNRESFGEKVYDTYHQYADIDDSTQNLNYE